VIGRLVIGHPGLQSEPATWLRRSALLLMLAAIVAGSAPGTQPVRSAFGVTPAAAPRIRLEVDGGARWVPLGWTLSDAIHHFRLHAPAGNLTAVNGKVLRRGAFPGQVLLNGEAAPQGTILEAGSTISLKPGRTRMEPLDRLVLNFGPGEVHDPQYSLETGAGREIISAGAVSHRGLNVVFQPAEPVRMPNAVALTFDDGPWEGSTRKVLAVLARERVKATFFLVGRQVRRFPDLVRDEVAAGMTIGTHSFSHPQAFGLLPPATIDQQIGQGLQTLTDLGVQTKLFRPPGGSMTPHVVAAAKAKGLRTVIWTVDPQDWRRGTTADQIAARVLAQVKPGSIVLLHDGGGDRSATVAALPRIIDGLKKRKLAITTL
jgi:peptidoglycan/xylan/chitin deacetylase (PgdA/CDA1 family)